MTILIKIKKLLASLAIILLQLIEEKLRVGHEYYSITSISYSW